MTRRTFTRSLLFMMLTLLFLLQPIASHAQSDALAAGDNALFIGDYPGAVAQYTAALADPNAKCDALYGLGLTHLRALEYADSESALTQYVNECGASFRALILRGQAREGTANPAGALEDYQQAINVNPGLLDSYLYERMATLSPDQSIYYLRLATLADRAPESKFTLRQKLADVYLLIGGTGLALDEYKTLLAEMDAYDAVIAQVEGAEWDTDHILRAQTEMTAATLELQLDQIDAGYARMQRIITDYPETPAAFDALVALVTADQPVDLLQRMRINVYNENYQPVIGVLGDAMSDPANANVPELYLLLGRAYRGTGDYESALATFQQVRDTFPTDPAATTAILEQGRTYEAAGDLANAALAYQAVSTTAPQSPEAPSALLHAAEIQRDQGALDSAVAIYDQLASQYPASEEAQQGLFEAAMFLRSSDPTRAAQYFGQAGTAEGYVWQGKLLAAQGNTDAARAAWQQGTAADPGSFFSMRACENLTGFDPFAPPQAVSVQPIGVEDPTEAEQWVAQTFGLDSISAELSPELANDPMLKRGVELWLVDFWSEARGEFNNIHKLHRDDPVSLLQLAFYYQTVPVYRSSVFAGIRLIFLSNQPITRIPQSILHLAYPFYFTDLFIQHSQANGLDPLLVAALVRQETSFDPFALSVADARGMMQLIPSTAQQVAGELDWSNFTLNDLWRPVVNIPFGTHYLADVKDAQGGSVEGALLSYNAGPGAAYSWLSEAGDDLDLLYQTIEYEETQQYLDFIHGNYVVYQYLYGTDVPACMFEGANPES